MMHGGAVFAAAEYLQTDYRKLLDFSANINPFGCPAGVQEAMRESLKRADCYPDERQRALRAAIAGAEGVLPEWVYAGNGAAELIYRLCFALRPGKGLVAAPTFLEYERALRAAGAKVYRAPLEPGMTCVREATDGGRLFLKQMQNLERGDMVFICTPNNPTGRCAGEGFLTQALAAAQERRLYLVIDECFLNFTGKEQASSMKRYLECYAGLFVLKSFTKMFVLPGIRIGCLLTAGEAEGRRLREAAQSWSVSCVAEAAGIAACAEQAFVQQTARRIAGLRESLKAGLEELGCQVVPGEANYLLFRMPQETGLCERLLEQGILLRSCADYPGLEPDTYRTAVRTEAENQKLLQAIKVVGREKENGRAGT